MAYEVYQLPSEVVKRLMQEKSTSSSMYRGQESSASPYEYTRETARKLFEHHGYRAVARFNVDSLNEVREASHRGEKGVIERLGKSYLRSVSAGDIIRDLNKNEYYIVNPFGFDDLKRLRRKI